MNKSLFEKSASNIKYSYLNNDLLVDCFDLNNIINLPMNIEMRIVRPNMESLFFKKPNIS